MIARRTASRGAQVVGVCVLLALAGCTSSGGSHPSSAPPATPTPASTSPTEPSTSASTSTSSASSANPGRVAPKLSAFRIADITYVGNQAWALGTAKCLSGGGTNCSAIEHSTNGRSWSSLPTPTGISVLPTAQGCKPACVDHIRFATPEVGYLFGGSRGAAGSGGTGSVGALYMTTDGGLHWRAQPGGADALESLNGNVIRAGATTAGCAPGCTYRAQTASVGGTSWHTAALPGAPSQGDGAFLARTGDHAYLLTVGNPAGGANNAKSVLYISSDNGRHWKHHPEPCPQSSHEVDSSGLTSAPDGSVSVLCAARGEFGRTYTSTSTDHGATFYDGSRAALGSATVTAFAAASAKVLLVSADDTYRSTDGGRHFVRLGANAGSTPGQLRYLGFATASVGHGISASRRQLWTTTDAGRTWSSHTFS